MLVEQLKPNVILRGPLFPEPVRVVVAEPLGHSVKVVAEGVKSEKVYRLVLAADQLSKLDASPEYEPFDGDPLHVRLHSSRPAASPVCVIEA